MSPNLHPLLRAAALCVLVLPFQALLPAEAVAWERGRVERFATLPVGAANPEGIAVDAQGDVYVSLFAVTAAGETGRLLVFDRRGELKRDLRVAGASNLLLGLAFHPLTNELLVLDFGQARVLRVDPHSGASELFMQAPQGAGLNALTFDRAGNVYVSDSFLGTIWRTGPKGGTALAWVSDALLRTSGTPPFGANGLEFNRAQTTLFVANTGDDRVIRVPVSAEAAGTPEVFANSINGADGLIVDADDNLWVAANQADEIVVLDPTGRAIAKLGDFDGLRRGAPRGLLFPASLVRSGEWLYVTNLSLDIRVFGLPQAVDSQWAAAVTSHTIARLRARIRERERDDDQ